MCTPVYVRIDCSTPRIIRIVVAESKLLRGWAAAAVGRSATAVRAAATAAAAVALAPASVFFCVPLKV